MVAQVEDGTTDAGVLPGRQVAAHVGNSFRGALMSSEQEFSISPSISRVLDQYARKFNRISRGSIPADEFRQIGLIAVWKASAKYDPSRGEFETYASVCIFREMFHYLRMTSHPMGWATRKGIDRPACGELSYDLAAARQDVPETREDFVSKIRDMFPVLSRVAAEVMALRYYDGLSCKEISKRIGKSEPRTSSILMATLREINPGSRSTGLRVFKKRPDHERAN